MTDRDKTLGKIDLHMHCDFSDGLATVEDIFRIAKKAKFRLIAVTDHDTAEHWDLVQQFGKLCKIPYILGTEFSSMYKGKEVHILGYNYDRNHPKVKEILDDYKDANVRWVTNLLLNFAAQTGIVVDITNFDFKGSPDKVRVTNFLLQEGHIQLEEGQSFPDLVTNTFKQGGKFHVKRKIKRRKYSEIIDAIHYAGGISAIAHPQKNRLEEDNIKEFADAGLDGVEVYCRKRYQDSIKYIEMADKFNLLKTGGSDFHGNGQLGIEYETKVLLPLLNKLNIL